MVSPLERTLRRFRLRLSRAEGAAGVVASVAVVFVWVFLALAMNVFFDAPTWTRLAYAIIGIVAVGFAVGETVIVPFVKRRKARDLASTYENLRSVGGELRTAVDFGEGRVFSRGHSSSLVRESVLRAEASISSTSSPRVPIPRTATRSARLALICAVGFMLAAVIDPPSISQALGRALNPLSPIEKPTPTIVVRPGNARVVSHSNLEVTAFVSGGSGEAFLTWRYPEGGFSRARMRNDGGEEFSATLTDLRVDVLYRVEAGGESSPLYSVEVIDVPRVARLTVLAIPPKHTNRMPVELPPGEGDVTDIVGTRVEVGIMSTSDLSEATLVFADSTQVGLNVDGRRADGHFTLLCDGSYLIRLCDTSGETNPSPVVYRLTSLPDLPPEVSLVYPPCDVDLDESLLLPLAARVHDDFGFSRVALLIAVNDSPEDTTDIHIADDMGTDAEFQSVLDLAERALLPEDVVALRIAVWDNDRVTGPKCALSRTVRARFPSLDEIIAEVQREQTGAENTARSALREAERVREALDDVRRELAGATEVNWEQEQDLREALGAQRHIAERIEEASDHLDSMIERLQGNELASRELVEKYSELQSLLSQVETPELKAAMQRLEQTLESLDPRMVRMAAEQLRITTEQLIERLDRSIALMQQLALEQTMDELVRTAEHLAEAQVEQNASTTDPDADADSLADRENVLSEELRTLMEEMERMRQALADSPRGEPDSMNEPMTVADQAFPEMSAMSDRLRTSNRSGAMEHGKRAVVDLEQLTEMLEEARQQFLSATKQDVLGRMATVIQKLLYLSERQETLRSDTDRRDARSSDLPRLATEQRDIQMGLTSATDDLRELSKLTMFVGPQIAADLGRSLTDMDRSVHMLSLRERDRALPMQQRAYAEMNDAVRRLLEAARNASQSSSGSGMQSLLDALKSMAGKQGQINEGSAQLPSGQKPGGMTPSDLAALQSLAAEQQALAERMRGLGEQFGGRSDVPGDLGSLAEEMEEVARELRQRGSRPEMLQRQERILSRLLDYQKSLLEREERETRRADRPGEFVRRAPDQLRQLDDGRTRSPDIEQVLREGVPRSYEARVRAYFEALARDGVR